MELEEHVPLAPLTTFYIGGDARFLVRARSVEDIIEALVYAKKNNLRVLILGGGSNVLIDDNGFDGLVIQNQIQGIDTKKEEESVVLTAGAGESWDALVAFAVERGLWGIENLSGIPGTVGAAPIQNIGAYGTELKDTLLWVDAIERETGKTVRLMNSECCFGYRSSIFKSHPERYVVTRAAIHIQERGVANISYKDLAVVFGDSAPTLPATRQAVLDIRARKFPNLEVEGTAGSFFLNPVVSLEKGQDLARQFPDLPQYSADGGFKLSLAWLLDHVLALKGTHIGGARLYENQPLVIVAARGTSSSDVRALAQEVQRQVKEKVGIEIEPEVKICKNFF